MEDPRLSPSPVGQELGRFAESRWPPEVFRRFQCVWLSEVMGLPPQWIADALALHVSTVRRIRAEFLREGLDAIDGKGNRGGRRNHYLTFQEEAEFLRENAAGGLRELKVAFEARVGSVVHKTTIYRLLERHGEKVGIRKTARTAAMSRKGRKGGAR